MVSVSTGTSDTDGAAEISGEITADGSSDVAGALPEQDASAKIKTRISANDIDFFIMIPFLIQ
jgi:hypothetical protein